MGEKNKTNRKLRDNYKCVLYSFSSTFNQMMMGSIGYIISGLISTFMCACACKLCKKRRSKWIRKIMESDTEDIQSEGQVEEVSSSEGSVIEMQEFSHTEENTYEVPIPSSSSIVMGGANPSTLNPYPDIPPKGWLPTIMNIAPGSISRPTKEKILSKFLEGGWVLHQGMQTEKIIKRVIHRNVHTVSTKKNIIDIFM